MAFVTTELNLIADGADTTPSLHFSSSLTTGLFIAAADTLGITAGANEITRYDTNGLTLAQGVAEIPVGTNALPTYTFTGDLDTGMSAAVADTLVLSTNGASRLTLTSTGPTFTASAIVDTDSGDLTLQANADANFVLLTKDPTTAFGAATKQYVDSVATGLDVKASCRLATAAALTSTRTVDVITASGNGALTVDGVLVSVSDRVLVKDGLDPADTEVAEITSITCVARASYTDNTGSTQDYFDMSDALNANRYRFHFDRAGTSANPPPADGLTLVEVDISGGGGTADETADFLQAEIDGLGGFSAPNPAAAIITVTNSAVGDAEDPDGATAVSIAIMIITVTTQGVTVGASNGIYTVTATGDVSNPFVLTRATDADTDAEVKAGMFTFVTEGTANSDDGFVLITDDPISVNFSAQTFTVFTTQGGDVNGPASAVDNAVARFDGITGKLLKDTNIMTIDNSGDFDKAGVDFIHERGGTGNFASGSAALDAVTTGTNNTAIGQNACGALTEDTACTAVGFNALLLNDGGANNVAIGDATLDAVTTGDQNTAVGSGALSTISTNSDSTAVGFNALTASTGAGNTAVGSRALDANIGAAENTAVGVDALGATTTGGFNTAVGAAALSTNISGFSNVAVGNNALLVSTASDNTAVGSYSLLANVGGQKNTAVGSLAGRRNISGSHNTSVGYLALEETSTGSFNTAIGCEAGREVSTNSDVTAVGFNALLLNTNAQNTAVGSSALAAASGTGCTAVGYQALTVNTSSNNTAVGTSALDANTAGARNASLGTGSLGTNISGNDCTAVGYNALTASITSQNTAVGSAALAAASGTDCTAVGFQALTVNTGANNTAVGSQALDLNVGGTQNTAVGAAALSTIAATNDCTAVGYNALNLCTGVGNTAVGSGAMDILAAGTLNVSVGRDALGGITSGSNCVAVGEGAAILSNGIDNTAIGQGALDVVATGTNNIAVGKDAGNALTLADSNNILIGSAGVVADSGEIRIGTSGTHTCVSLPGSLALVDENFTTPTTGATVTILASESIVVIDPAGTLAALTVAMPASPKDGQIVKIIITEDITTLTHSSGGTIEDPLPSPSKGFSSGTWYYRLTNTTWYPVDVPVDDSVGDVVGPGSSTDEAFARWDTTTGKLLQDSAVSTMNDNGLITFTEGTTALRGIVFPDSLADGYHLSNASGNIAITINTTTVATPLVELPAGRLDFTDAVTGANEIRIVDNLADSLSIAEGTNQYMTFVTTDAAEQVVTNQDASFEEGVIYNVTALSGNTTLSGTHFFVTADTNAGGFTITLPAVATNAGRQYKIALIVAGNDLTIDPNGAETIDGLSASVILSTVDDHITLISDGTAGWYTM